MERGRRHSPGLARTRRPDSNRLLHRRWHLAFRCLRRGACTQTAWGRSVKTSHKIAVGSSAGVIACCVAFTPIWEGMDSVAKVDRIGTGHPITYCNGLTSQDGKVKIGQQFTKKE